MIKNETFTYIQCFWSEDASHLTMEVIRNINNLLFFLINSVRLHGVIKLSEKHCFILYLMILWLSGEIVICNLLMFLKILIFLWFSIVTSVISHLWYCLLTHKPFYFSQIRYYFPHSPVMILYFLLTVFMWIYTSNSDYIQYK